MPSDPARATGRRPCRLVAVEQDSRGVLGLLHVRLVERIDAEERAGDGRRDFPSDELRAERRRLRQLDLARSARPRPSARRRPVVARPRRGEPCEPEADEEAIAAVVGRLRRAARRRSERRRCRACRCSRRRAARPRGRTVRAPVGSSSVSLSRPRARRRRSRVRAPRLDSSSTSPTSGLARRQHRERPADERGEVLSHQRRRHEAEERERRVAAADVGRIDEHVAESFASRASAQLGAFVGDRDEVIGPVRHAGLLQAPA